MNDIIRIAAIALVIIVSLPLHEFAHAYVAHLNGDDTARRMGRMTVNPVAHFDPVGFIMLLVVGFGFAKPVPVNSFNFRRKSLGIFTVAVAGVIVNMLIAFLFTFVFYMLMTNINSISIVNRGLNELFWQFFYLMPIVNITLFFFNLLPIFPLDGFRVVESFTRFNNRFVQFMRRYGFFILIGLMIWSFVVDMLIRNDILAPKLWYLDFLGYYLSKATNFVFSGFLKFFAWIFG